MLSQDRIDELMRTCIAAAHAHEKGIYKPYVGALVLASDGEIIGTGTKRFIIGTNNLSIHAERDALTKARRNTFGGTLITTLEPCVALSRKKQILIPCAELIREKGIKRVIIGIQDVCEGIDGKGIMYLRDKGIQTMLYTGTYAKEIRNLLPFRKIY